MTNHTAGFGSLRTANRRQRIHLRLSTVLFGLGHRFLIGLRSAVTEPFQCGFCFTWIIVLLNRMEKNSEVINAYLLHIWYRSEQHEGLRLIPWILDDLKPFNQQMCSALYQHNLQLNLVLRDHCMSTFNKELLILGSLYYFSECF